MFCLTESLAKLPAAERSRIAASDFSQEALREGDLIHRIFPGGGQRAAQPA